MRNQLDSNSNRQDYEGNLRILGYYHQYCPSKKEGKNVSRIFISPIYTFSWRET